MRPYIVIAAYTVNGAVQYRHSTTVQRDATTAKQALYAVILRQHPNATQVQIEAHEMGASEIDLIVRYAAQRPAQR